MEGRINRRSIALLVLLLASSFTTVSEDQPNIIFILADDLGYTDVACFGSKYYETPNIDKLAAQGTKMTRHHHCQNCQPTRAELMSGQYGARTGVYTVGGIGRFIWETRPLRPVENVTELPLGKVTIAQTMKKADYATGMFGKWHLGEKGEYLADFLTNKAVDFIQRHKDEPFFLYLPHFGVHSPHQGKAEPS